MFPKLGLLARNTLWMAFGQGLRILLQFGYFVLIARILHADGYGAFAGAVALVTVLFPFAGWGSGNLLIKNVARRADSFAVYWGRALIVSALSAGALIALSVGLAAWILPASVPLVVVLYVAVADLLFTRLLEVAIQAFQAHQRLRESALLSILLSVAKLAAVLVLMQLSPVNDLLAWAMLYLCSSALVAILGCLWVSMEFGGPRWDVTDWRDEFREGFYFASSTSAQRVYLESDKALLTRLATLEATGVYAVGTRIVEVVLVPVYALLAAAYARFFLHGRAGLKGTLELCARLMPYALAYILVVVVLLYVCAPLIPWLLGEEFSDTASVVRWLALVPALMTVHRFAADSLSGAGYQGLRAACEFAAAVVNVLINLALIPRFGWRGAAIAALATEFLLVVLLWAAVGWRAAAERRLQLTQPQP